MAGLVSGLAPVQRNVTTILQAVRELARSGLIPGGEAALGQIVALTVSLLPMAANSALQPGQGGGGGPVTALPGAQPPTAGM